MCVLHEKVIIHSNGKDRNSNANSPGGLCFEDYAGLLGRLRGHDNLVHTVTLVLGLVPSIPRHINTGVSGCSAFQPPNVITNTIDQSKGLLN